MMKLQRVLSFGLICIAVASLAATAGSQSIESGPPRVFVADIEGAIGPATVHFVGQAIDTAQTQNAEALILRLNTPGGLASSMREVVQSVLAARVPVIGYVAPSGAHAASAGTFVLYATHVAAMTPGANIGAASPVQIGAPGTTPSEAPDREPEAVEQPAGAMDAKATNDAVALIVSLAQMRGRNAQWAESAVREAAALSAPDALEAGVIEIVASNEAELLAMLDGRMVETAAGQRTLRTGGAILERIEPSWITSALGVLANPNVALLLMLIGVYGVIYEFLTPGTIGPGLVGAIALILGLYALNQLPLNYAGLALVLFGLTLMVVEAFTPSFGVVGLAGVIAFVIGALMLVDTEIEAFRLSPGVIAAAAAMSAAVLVFILGVVIRAQAKLKASGAEGLLGQMAQVLDWRGGEGHVWAQGERWSARAGEPLIVGQNVRIVGREALTLRVSAGEDQ